MWCRTRGSYFEPEVLFEGRVDSTGLVVGGATATFPNGCGVGRGERPLLERSPFASCRDGQSRDISNAPRRLVMAETVRLRPRVFGVSDGAAIRVTWRSSEPSVVRVDADGLLTAVGAGRATITATAVPSVIDAVDVPSARVASVRVLASRRHGR